MLIAVNGHYDGSQIVIDEDVKMTTGQKVIITLLDEQNKTHSKPDLKQYMGRGEKLFHTDAQDYVKGLRNNDRV